jgi:Domain of unknown function (DUF4389)
MYPVRYVADYTEERRRWTTFFRLLLAIPWLIVASVYAFCAFVVAFIAWFTLVFVARYPEGLYNFNSGVVRFLGRFYGFAYLQTDAWPSFGFADDAEYPIRVEIDPPLERYNRWKALFRLILGIPVMVVLYLITQLYQLASVVAWLHIVFRGRNSGGIHNVLTVGLAYQLRATAYFLLMTETLPPVSDQAPAGNLGPATGAAVTTSSTQHA